MEKAFYDLEAEERIALTRSAHESRHPVMVRWGKVEPDLGERWQYRAAIAAEWLDEAASIADLGCGSMNLERCLRRGQDYIPVDLARRDNRTLVLDLNKAGDLARLPVADACALLGVLEYVYAPHELIAALRDRYTQVIVTFNIRREDENTEERLANGWVNHFTRDGLLLLFAGYDYALSRDHFFKGSRRREYLFDFRRVPG